MTDHKPFPKTLVEIDYGDVSEGMSTGLWDFTHEPELDVRAALIAAAHEANADALEDIMDNDALLAKHGLHPAPSDAGYLLLNNYGIPPELGEDLDDDDWPLPTEAEMEGEVSGG
jgi:hypothetical protein